MKIALIFPKSTFLEDPMVFPPLGLWYLAAQLEAQGHATDFFTLDVDDLPRAGEFDQLWISATSPQMHEVRRLAHKTASWRKTKTVLGGACAWADPATCLQLPFDVVVGGESDHPDSVRQIVDLAASVQVPRGQTKHAVHFAPAITPGPLSWCLPPVRRWDGKYNAYLKDRDGARHRTTTLFTSRGCPMACAFCESGRNGVIWDRFVRYEAVYLVEEQVREAVERGHTGLMFYDDILPLNKPRTLELLEVLKKYGIVWRCFLRTDVISKQGGADYLKELAHAGLVEVLAGVESADNRVKNNIHKGTTIEQDTQVLAWCKSLGIRFKASFILGLPGEDWDSMRRTRDWILTNRPDYADVNTLIPFPGTPITKDKDYLGNEYDLKWETELAHEMFYKGFRNTTNALVSTSHLSAAEIGQFRNDLVKEMQDAGIAMAVTDRN